MAIEGTIKAGDMKNCGLPKDPPITFSVETKPLLVIQLSQALTHQMVHQYHRIKSNLAETGWFVIVFDCMSESRVDAYMPNGGTMKGLDLAEFEEWIKEKINYK